MQEQYSANSSGTQQDSSTEDRLKQIWNESPPFPIASDTTIVKVAVPTEGQCKTQLEAALRYASYGIPVLPCNWQSEKQKDGSYKIKKYPLIAGGVYGATIDPIIITSWWTRWPLALIGVPGGRRTGMWFLDADSKEAHGEDGLGNWWELEAQHSSAKTRAHLTGTSGLHFIFKWNADRPVGCPTSTVPPGIEIKGNGGYVIFPPSPYERNGQTVRYSVSDDCFPEPAPEWLLDKILGKRSRSKGNGSAAGGFTWSEGFGQKKLDEYCELIRTAEQHHWDEACRKLWKFAKWVGGGACDIKVALEAVLEAAKQNKTAPSDYVDNVERAFKSGVAQPEGPFVEDESITLNDFRAYMPQHSYIYIPTRELWPVASVNARIPSIDNKIKASAWLDQHRPVEQMTWAPGQEMLIHNQLMAEGGWIAKQGATCFNRYMPPTMEPGDATKAGPWIEHVRKLFGDDAEHLIKWCAQRVQHPEIKINHALILGSEEHGIGKDAMLEPVKRAVGHWNFKEANPQQILGRFNGFLQSVILRINEARDLGDVNRYQFYDHTKAFTASPPDVLRVDEKYVNTFSILNCVGLIITTNYKAKGIYLPIEDRRHYVAWSNLTRADFAEGYWPKLWNWYDAGGDRDVAAFLAEYNITDFDPKAPPPKTQAFYDIVEANSAPEDTELDDILDQLRYPNAVCLLQIAGRAEHEFSQRLKDRKYIGLIPSLFDKAGYERIKNPNSEKGLWRVCGKKQMIYVKKDLSFREQILAAEELVKKEEPPEFMR